MKKTAKCNPRYAPLNKAESRTLAKIVRAGPRGALLSTLDRRHLGRLDRRGLIRMEGSPLHPACRIVALADSYSPNPCTGYRKGNRSRSSGGGGNPAVYNCDSTHYGFRASGPLHPTEYAQRNPSAKRNPRKRNPVVRTYKIPDWQAKAVADHVRAMTRRNDHGAAYVYIATYALRSTTLADKFKAINDRAHRRGYIDANDAALRYELYQRMMAQLKRRASPGGYKLIYGAT